MSSLSIIAARAYYLITTWGMASYWPFFGTCQFFYLEILPNIFTALPFVASALFNRYFIMPFSLLVMLSYKFELASTIVIFTLIFPVLVPMMFISLVFTPSMIIASSNTLLLLKLGRSLYNFLRADSDWRITNIFKHPRSEESLLFNGLAIGLSLLLEIWAPILIMGGSTLGGYLGIKIHEAFQWYFSTTEERAHSLLLTLANQQTIPSYPNYFSKFEYISIPHQTTFTWSVVPAQFRTMETSPNSRHVIKAITQCLEASKNDYLLSDNNNFFLRHCAQMGKWDLVSQLLKKPNVFFNSDCENNIVLLTAINKHQWEIVSTLVNHPVFLFSPQKKENQNALRMLGNAIVDTKNMTLLNQIIHSPIYHSVPSDIQYEFLQLAIEKKHLCAMTRLIKDERVAFYREFPALQILINELQNSLLSETPNLLYHTHTEKTLFLLSHPKNESLLNGNNNFFLRHAAKIGRWDIVSQLLKTPNVFFNVTCQDHIVLLTAIEKNQWNIVSTILTHPVFFIIPMQASTINALNNLIITVIEEEKIEILNQIVHSAIYNVFDRSYQLVFFQLAAQKKHTAILTKLLTDQEFISSLQFEQIGPLLKPLDKDLLNILSSYAKKIITHAKNATYHELTISDIPIGDFINQNDFKTIHDLQLFYINPIDFIKLNIKNKPHNILALDILLAKNTYVKIKNILHISKSQDTEGAQTPEEVITANELFEKIKNHYQQTFEEKQDHRSALDVIEHEIKSTLLDQILLEAEENVIKNYHKDTSEKIITLIAKHKNKLLDGHALTTKALLKQLEKLIPDNISAIQTAWLSYDPTHNIDIRGWKFLVPPENERGIYTTAEATENNIPILNTLASEQVRLRIAYYWLAITDPMYPDPDNFRLGNFFGIISSIYRTNGFGQSCCYPGHLTNIAKMGVTHPIAEPLTLENLIDQLLITPVIQAFKTELQENIQWTIEEKETALSSLSYIHEKNATLFLKNHTPSPINMAFQTNFSTKHFSSISSTVYAELLSNNCYAARNLSPFELKEIEYAIQYKLLSMGSNQFILSALNDLILHSRCTKQDIHLEDMSPFLPTSPKHSLYLTLAENLNHQIRAWPDDQLPTIQTLNNISSLCQQLINDLGHETDTTDSVQQFQALGLNIDILHMQALLATPSQPILMQFNHNIQRRTSPRLSTIKTAQHNAHPTFK